MEKLCSFINHRTYALEISKGTFAPSTVGIPLFDDDNLWLFLLLDRPLRKGAL